MPTFDSPGAGLSRGIRTGAAILDARKGRELEADKQQQEEATAALKRIEDAAAKAQEMAVENVSTLSTHAASAAEKGATPEQLEQMRRAAQAAAMTYGEFLEESKAFAEKSGIDPNLIPSGRDFVEQQLALYDAAVSSASIEDTSDDFETLSPEDVAELGFPDGAIVQRGPDNKITLTFDPTQDKSLSAFKEKVDALTPFVGEEMAVGIAGGRFAVSTNPITNESVVLDKATGEVVGEVKTPAVPTETPPVVTPGTDPTEAVGGAGFLKNAANIVTDAIGQGAAFEDTQQATTALNVIQQQTKLTLQVVIKGRPAKDIREGLKKLTVTPNSIFQGEARAKSSLEGTKRMIDNEIVRMENMLDTELSPKDRGDITNNLSSLKEISRSHQDLIDAFDEEEEVDPELEELLNKHAPKDDT